MLAVYRLALALLGLGGVFSSLAPSGTLRGQEVDAMVLKAEQERIAAIDRAVPTAVSVFVPGGAGGGSGVLISPDGYALTNFHVSSPAGSFMRCSLADGSIYDAVIVGIDPVGDLALIRLLGRDDFPAAELGDSNLLRAGQWCFVVGNPFLLATNLQPTVTWGMLSGVHRYQYPSGTLLEYADCLQTDASINPGNSGGPIYDASGKLIGIVGRCSFEKRGRVNVGVGYAISINQAKNFLGNLRSGRIVDHATLGATVVTDPEGGVRVSNILPSSDAYRRGLRYNDEITEISGRTVQTANDVQNVLGTLPKGWRIPLTFIREGRRSEILVRLAGVHAEDELLEKMATALPPPPPAPPIPGEKTPDEKTPDSQAPNEGAPNEDAPNEDVPKSAEPTPLGADGKPIPEGVLAVLEERRGYANYFFNRQHQQRLYEALKRHNPVAQRDAKSWHIRGALTDGTTTDVEILVSEQACSLRLGKNEYKIGSTAERFDAVDRQTAAAMLTGLDHWRRMLELGPEQFGESYYLGTGPFLGKLPQRDYLVGTASELESHFVFHPESGLLEAVEIFADRAQDPAELLVEWGQDAGSAPRPVAIELRFGTDQILRVQITNWDVNAEAGQS